MTPLAAMTLRPLAAHDAHALLAFYNGLNPASIRTFRPLGLSTTLDACEKIMADTSAGDMPAGKMSVEDTTGDKAKRYDLGAWQGDTLVGWGFVAGLDTAQPEFGLGVADAWQGQGVGSALIDGVLTYARKMRHRRIYLIAVQDNARAIGLYASRGFIQYDEMTGDWDGLPYVKMVVELA